MSTIDTSMGPRVLRLKPSVPRTFGLSGAALILPIAAVLYLLTIPVGTWPAVLVAHALVSLAYIAASLGLRRAGVWVDTAGISLRSPLGRRREIGRACIRQLLLVQTYRGQTLDTQPQLFISTEDGSAPIRLPGSLWSQETMGRIAHELDIPLTTVEEPMTPGELRRTHPHLLTWLERRRAAWVTTITAGVALGMAAAAALLCALGLPGPVHL